MIRSCLFAILIFLSTVTLPLQAEVPLSPYPEFEVDLVDLRHVAFQIELSSHFQTGQKRRGVLYRDAVQIGKFSVPAQPPRLFHDRGIAVAGKHIYDLVIFEDEDDIYRYRKEIDTKRVRGNIREDTQWRESRQIADDIVVHEETRLGIGGKSQVTISGISGIPLKDATTLNIGPNSLIETFIKGASSSRNSTVIIEEATVISSIRDIGHLSLTGSYLDGPGGIAAHTLVAFHDNQGRCSKSHYGRISFKTAEKDRIDITDNRLPDCEVTLDLKPVESNIRIKNNQFGARGSCT